MLVTLAQEMGNLPNKLSIEGHTDSTPYAPSTAYGNWELSSDRANAARRVMQANGVRPDQVTQVRGFADQRLREQKTEENKMPRPEKNLSPNIRGDGRFPERGLTDQNDCATLLTDFL
jgi:chemotaxis protein MotB